ncbi:TNF receptor-associated factor family protein DDB_G0272098 [Stomoxys calcitrans]|uniref:TNF receptor-associated factor family protein DDB_G0272098 n=1 Tax=Stomoxys calcitrans TaxID=35570 RepID=UPI0027E2F638|nr:TNF receptor-associated factor family protein DDB_G0272098 [Stomoxys calcitrans]
MKFFIGLLAVTSLALNGVLSLPARDPSEDAEVIGYPRRVSTRSEAEDDDDFKDFKGVIDTGSGYPFLQPNPSVLNFGFFDSFDDIFRRFSARLFPTTLLGRGDDSDEASGSGGVISTNFDPKKGNTTSTVKVVDGHKVEVNETVYGDEHSIFKVRVVNVRPLEEGETVEETVQTGVGEASSDNKPVTSSPAKAADSEEDDDDERREPLAKKPLDNEIERNIDDPEHSIRTENIVEATTSLQEDNNPTATPTTTTMLPTNAEEVDFVTENTLEALADGAENDENNNGNGNNEFETNMSSSLSLSAGESNNVDDAIGSATDIAATIENNEDTEEVNDNLNESSNNDGDDADADDGDDAQAAPEFSDADSDDAAVNTNVRLSNYASVIRNKYREDVSSSDDETDETADVDSMPPSFNDEWGSYNEQQIGFNRENNDFNNDIDVYDVKPIDLSNDIAVNDSPNLPINPDAEFVDIFGAKQSFESMPKFEKLSLGQMPEDVEHLSSFSGEMK